MYGGNMKRILVLTGAVLLSLSLYACNQASSASQAVSEAGSLASEAASDVASVGAVAASEAESAVSEAVSEVGSAASEAASSVGAEVSSEVASAVDENTFTLDELAQYNGKDGAKAYIAVDGIVYDVTDSKAWNNGVHNGYEAGKDLSEEMRKAPHGISKLDGITPVGILAE